LHTRQQLQSFANAGHVSWLRYIGGPKPQVPKNDNGDYLMNNDIYIQNGPNIQKVEIVKKKLDDILIQLNPVEYGFSESSSLQLKHTMEISYMLEEMFADEINALYYFNLYYDYEYKDITSYPVMHNFSFNGNKQFPILARPKDCLSSIFQNDREIPLISEWFYRWMQDIRDLQWQVYEAIELMRDTIGRRIGFKI
jgi:hypothetical protein